MNAYLKKQIADEVKRLVVINSQQKVANSLGVNVSTINKIVNDKNTEGIADKMWYSIKVATGVNYGWQIAEIHNYQVLTGLLMGIRTKKMAIGVAVPAGAGKTTAYQDFANTNEEVVYVECANYWSKKTYIEHLLRGAGSKAGGTTVEMIERFIKAVKQMPNPVIIIDQADKLKDPQLDLFMDLYNALKDHCTFLLSGTSAFEKRIKRGVNREKAGYEELYSRIGRKFIYLPPISIKDVTAICEANGLKDGIEIKSIYNSFDNDLRKVKRSVEAWQLKQEVV